MNRFPISDFLNSSVTSSLASKYRFITSMNPHWDNTAYEVTPKQVNFPYSLQSLAYNAYKQQMLTNTNLLLFVMFHFLLCCGAVDTTANINLKLLTKKCENEIAFCWNGKIKTNEYDTYYDVTMQLNYIFAVTLLFIKPDEQSRLGQNSFVLPVRGMNFVSPNNKSFALQS
jgi:hypothetical protein